MKTKIANNSLCLLIIVCTLSACKKDWLDAKPNKALVVPTRLADYQALLDNSQQMNIDQPSISMLGDGDFFISDSRYLGLSPPEQSAYLWAATKNFYGGAPSYDWQVAFARILAANVCLSGLQSLQELQQTAAYQNVAGSALFERSLDNFNLSQLYCKSYDHSTADKDLGLPLRRSPNVNISLKRASLAQSYGQIISDLQQAVRLLPQTPLYPTRPSKAAAYGLLARVYLSQSDYNQAGRYADSSLQLYHQLLDYNTLDPAQASPMSRFNAEVIYHYTLCNYLAFRTSRLKVDTSLYQSYADNDLRKSLYFIAQGTDQSFKGSYDGDRLLFGGIATDELYLERAECYARAGNTAAAMKDLNTLLKTRWLAGSYVPKVAASADEALRIILTERRKELCFRGLRWMDLRRLNKEPSFQTTIRRIIGGQSYTLLPNSARYTLPLDDFEIQKGGLEQNPR